MPNDFNQRIIDEFRANAGKVGGPFAGAPMVLLTSIGAKSGQPHTTPLVYMQDGERIVVFASMGGAPRNPAWYHNLVAHSDVSIEVGTERYAAKAVITSGDERDTLFRRQATLIPTFDEYQKKTTRTIPVIALERAT
ncbi:MAG TPA: nitroreductase family deazaflavin-dependent oxidoreductase [Dehalococcoidia bacterium]